MEGKNRQAIENFQGSENILYYTTVMDTCHCKLSTPTEGTTLKVYPNKLWTLGDNDVSTQVH